MAKRNPEGNCFICGEYGPLSLEHIPPKKAFNNETILLRQFQERNYGPNLEDNLYVRPHQSGHKRFTLCRSCNNNTGNWYGRAYVDFVKQIANKDGKAPNNSIVMLNIEQLYPLRLVKQALSMFCSTTGDKTSSNHGGVIRELLLCKESYSLRPTVRIYMYIRSAEEGVLASGQMIRAVPERGILEHYAEVSMWPIGWVFTYPKHNTQVTGLDVTHWLRHQYGDCADAFLAIPVRPATYVPTS